MSSHKLKSHPKQIFSVFQNLRPKQVDTRKIAGFPASAYGCWHYYDNNERITRLAADGVIFRCTRTRRTWGVDGDQWVLILALNLVSTFAN